MASVGLFATAYVIDTYRPVAITYPQAQGETMCQPKERPLVVGSRVMVMGGEMMGRTGRVREVMPKDPLIGPGDADPGLVAIERQYATPFVTADTYTVVLYCGPALITCHVRRIE